MWVLQWYTQIFIESHQLKMNNNMCSCIVWLYFVFALYLLNPWWVLQITLYKCQVWWDDVQCLCLTKVGSRSRSQSKIKHCMTVFRVRSISFKPLVGFTNYYTPTTKCGGGAILDSLCHVGRSVGQSVRLQFLSAL